MFKTSGRLLFNLFGYFSNTKKCVFKISGRLLFNLFGYISNTKNGCWNQAGRCFLIYLTTFLIQKNVCSKQLEVGDGGWCWTSCQIFKKGHNLTSLFIVFIHASLLSLHLLPGSLLQDTLLFNLDWFEQLFAQQLTSFVLWKFSSLSYDLNIVCMIKI